MIATTNSTRRAESVLGALNALTGLDDLAVVAGEALGTDADGGGRGRCEEASAAIKAKGIAG